MQIVLECPKCRVAGRVHWNKLAGCLRCKACGVNFELGKDGKVRRSPLVQQRCPRCQSVVSRPKKSGRLRCPACKFEIPVDGHSAPTGRTSRPHSSAQPLEKRKQADRQRGTKRPGKHRASRAESTDSSRRIAIGLTAVAMLVIGLVCWWALAGGIDSELRASVGELMAAAIQGDSEGAQDMVVSGQEADFRNWFRLSFRPALQQHSFAGAGKLRIELEKQEGDTSWVEVRIQAGSDDELCLYQAWRPTSDGWRLQARETARRARQKQRAKSIKVNRNFSM